MLSYGRSGGQSQPRARASLRCFVVSSTFGRLSPPPVLDLLPAPTRDRLESHLRHRLAGVLDANRIGPLAQAVQDYVLAGGKRLRPQLCLWTLSHCGEDESGDAAMDVACGWELFHAFLLVHDDIIDAADRRRSRPSLHRHLASLDSDSAAFGVNLGIVAGDLLFAAAMTLWHGADLDGPPLRDMLRLLSRVALQTGVGQAADIVMSHAPLSNVDGAAVLRGYHGKTAAYTFEGPMLSGAILGGAGESARACLSRFAVALGQAYQLHNDLLDLAGPINDGCDLVQGKRTLTLVTARQLAGEEGGRRIDAALSAIRPGAGDACDRAADLREMIYAVGAVEATRRGTADLLEEARAAAGDGRLPGELSRALGGLLGDLERGYFA